MQCTYLKMAINSKTVVPLAKMFDPVVLQKDVEYILDLAARLCWDHVVHMCQLENGWPLRETN